MKSIDLNELSEFLIEADRFLLEAELIGKFFPGIKVYAISSMELYYIHFVLFHHLYKLKSMLEKQGIYLHIHFMRIGLVHYPPENKCQYFEADKLEFCEKDTNGKFCEEHLPSLLTTETEAFLLPATIDSTALFYLDKSNYSFFSEEVLESWYSCVNHVLKNNEYYPQALKLLNLTEAFTIPSLKQNYRKLAKQYHPDLNPTHTSDYQKFLEINRAYQYLLRCLPML